MALALRVQGAATDLVNGYLAYFGTYAVDTTAGTVTHNRSAHVNAEVGHLSVVRHYQFEGDMLTLTVEPDQDIRIKWKRQD